MDGLHAFLVDVKRRNQWQGQFLGLVHLLIGHRIRTEAGEVVACGMNWRTLADWLKRVRWEKEAALELGQDPGSLPPRDRERFWYLAIARAGIDTPQAARAGEKAATWIKKYGYVVESLSAIAQALPAPKS